MMEENSPVKALNENVFHVTTGKVNAMIWDF